MANKKGKSIAIFSAKGGVGKSSTVLNMAGIYSANNKKVLIIDADLTGGAIATYLNKAPENTIFNFADDYANNRFSSLSPYITKYTENIHFIACPKDPRQGTRISASYIEILIGKAIYDYDVVLLDTNHSLSEFNVILLDTVDSILLVMTNDLLDIKNMRNIIHIFNDVKKSNYKILLNSSIHPNKKYYGLYDIKSIIKSNIDYIIDSSFNVKSIDNYVSDGKIITLEKKLKRYNSKIYNIFSQMCNDMVGDENE